MSYGFSVVRSSGRSSSHQRSLQRTGFEHYISVRHRANYVAVRIGIGQCFSEIDFAGSEGREGVQVDSIQPSNYKNDVYLLPQGLVEKVATLHLHTFVAFLIVSTQIKQTMQVSRSSSLQTARRADSEVIDVGVEAHLLQRTDICPVLGAGTTKSSFLLEIPGSEYQTGFSTTALCFNSATFTRGWRDHRLFYVHFFMPTGFMYEFVTREQFIANSVVDNKEFLFLEFAAYDCQTGSSPQALYRRPQD